MWLLGPEARLEGRGQTTPTAIPSCASRTSVLNQVLTGHWKSTGSPQAIPQRTHVQLSQGQNAYNSNHNCSTTLPTYELTSFPAWGRATTPPHNHTHFTPLLPFLRLYSLHNHAGVVCLINIGGCRPGHTRAVPG